MVRTHRPARPGCGSPGHRPAAGRRARGGLPRRRHASVLGAAEKGKRGQEPLPPEAPCGGGAVTVPDPVFRRPAMENPSRHPLLSERRHYVILAYVAGGGKPSEADDGKSMGVWECGGNRDAIRASAPTGTRPVERKVRMLVPAPFPPLVLLPPAAKRRRGEEERKGEIAGVPAYDLSTYRLRRAGRMPAVLHTGKMLVSLWRRTASRRSAMRLGGGADLFALRAGTIIASFTQGHG